MYFDAGGLVSKWIMHMLLLKLCDEHLDYLHF